MRIFFLFGLKRCAIKTLCIYNSHIGILEENNMNTLDYKIFMQQLELGECINEFCFYFDNDSEMIEHILGYDSDRENPYWVGICDMGKGMSFSTAEQLVDAPIYNGKSLKQRWSNVRINSIEGVGVEEWLELFVDGGVTRRKVE